MDQEITPDEVAEEPKAAVRSRAQPKARAEPKAAASLHADTLETAASPRTVPAPRPEPRTEPRPEPRAEPVADARDDRRVETRDEAGASDALISRAKTADIRPSSRPKETRPRPAEMRPVDATDPREGFRGSDPRPAAAEPTVPTNIYRARRPAVAVFLIIPALAVGFLLVRALAISAFGTPFLIGGVIASSSGLAALPLLVAGLYGLITGAAHGAEQWGFKVWAKPPLAYLVVGLSLVIAAGVAIR